MTTHVYAVCVKRYFRVYVNDEKNEMTSEECEKAVRRNLMNEPDPETMLDPDMNEIEDDDIVGMDYEYDFDDGQGDEQGDEDKSYMICMYCGKKTDNRNHVCAKCEEQAMLLNMRRKTLMEILVEYGYPKEEFYHHESDLYVYEVCGNLHTEPILRSWYAANGINYGSCTTRFRDQVTGRIMFDCYFMYSEEEKSE